MDRRITQTSKARIMYVPRPDATPESELNTLVAVYKFVLFDSQTRRGGLHDLTDDSTNKQTTRQEKKGKENADIHGD
jgi:hypothetical protein